MICPNCGRELPDTARVCLDCNAVQRVFKRKHADADIPEDRETVRVHKRVAPDTQQEKRAVKMGDQKQTPPPAVKHIDRKNAARDDLPLGLARQQMQSKSQVRHVRRAPRRISRKVDSRPEMMNPPIYRKSHRKLLTIVFIILLVMLFVFSAGGYMLFQTENGQRLMATWGWSVARTDAYITLGREYLEQAYFTRALEKLQIAIDREPENVDALVLMGQAYTELGFTEDAVTIYESLIQDIAPQHPSAYRNLIRIYQNQG